MLTNDGFLTPSESLASQLSRTISARLPLESALRALAAQNHSPRTRQALLELSKRLEEGMPLDQAYSQTKSALPPSLRPLIQIGIETGRMDAIMRYCVERSQRAISLQQSVWLSLSYPLFLMWMALSICSAIGLTVVPFFERVFDDFGTELPAFTEGMIRCARGFHTFGWFGSLLIPVGGLCVWLLFILIGLRGSGATYFASIPVLGRIFQYAALAEFCELLAFLVQSEVSLSKVIMTAAESTENYWLKRKCRKLVREIEHGVAPGDAAAACYMPNTLAFAFREIDSQQQFVGAMHGLREVFASQAQVTARVVSRLISNLAITGVVVFVFLTGICLFIPLIKLLNDLS